MTSAAAAARTAIPEDPSAQTAYRWAAQARSLAEVGLLVLDAVVVA